jgi:ribosomal protein L31E
LTNLYTISSSKDNAAARRRLRRRITNTLRKPATLPTKLAEDQEAHPAGERIANQEFTSSPRLQQRRQGSYLKKNAYCLSELKQEVCRHYYGAPSIIHNNLFSKVYRGGTEKATRRIDTYVEEADDVANKVSLRARIGITCIFYEN